MRELRFRRVARFEQLANAYLKRRERETEIPEYLRNIASPIVANLSCLILFGEPRIDEPLPKAWERCLESAAWQACREKHGGFSEYGTDDGTPFDNLGVTYIAKYFRRYFLPDLPGADEIEKFSMIFKEAPPWLLWFTYGDLDAHILGIELPDLSEISRFARGEQLFMRLPPGPFELQRLPDGVYDRYYTPQARDTFEDKAKNMTSRERKRMRRVYDALG
jgi:hypothetical protein